LPITACLQQYAAKVSLANKSYDLYTRCCSTFVYDYFQSAAGRRSRAGTYTAYGRNTSAVLSSGSL